MSDEHSNNDGEDSADPIQNLYLKVVESRDSFKRRLAAARRDGKPVSTGDIATVVEGDVFAMLLRILGLMQQMRDGIVEDMVDIDNRVDALESPSTMIMPEHATLFRECFAGTKDLIALLREKATLGDDAAKTLTDLSAKVDAAIAIVDEFTVSDDDSDDEADGDDDNDDEDDSTPPTM